jgi:hypothetical protein
MFTNPSAVCPVSPDLACIHPIVMFENRLHGLPIPSIIELSLTVNSLHDQVTLVLLRTCRARHVCWAGMPGVKLQTRSSSTLLRCAVRHCEMHARSLSDSSALQTSCEDFPRRLGWACSSLVLRRPACMRVAKDSIEVIRRPEEVFDKARDAQRVHMADFDWAEHTGFGQFASVFWFVSRGRSKDLVFLTGSA